MIPGSDLLSQALGLIASQTVTFYAWLSRYTNSVGKDVDEFAEGVDITFGSVQAVPANRYEQLGLDRKRSYVTWFVPAVSVEGLRRNRNSDQFVYAGRRYSITSETPWAAQDGWREIVGMDIGAA